LGRARHLAFELKHHKIEHGRSRDIFVNAFECVSAGLMNSVFTYAAPHYSYSNVTIVLRPLRRPHPAYGSSNTTGATWAGERGIHFTSLGPTGFTKKNAEAFREALSGWAANPKAELSGTLRFGVLRYIFLADTDAEAKRFAKACDGIPSAYQGDGCEVRRPEERS
jgi:alkanesulfonate monooxygenase SsuD/methylene tetrahydromethanopterin reductase-like flavin-dependent oxidoreductase (luciferase family)